MFSNVHAVPNSYKLRLSEVMGFSLFFKQKLKKNFSFYFWLRNIPACLIIRRLATASNFFSCLIISCSLSLNPIDSNWLISSSWEIPRKHSITSRNEIPSRSTQAAPPPQMFSQSIMMSFSLKLRIDLFLEKLLQKILRFWGYFTLNWRNSERRIIGVKSWNLEDKLQM